MKKILSSITFALLIIAAVVAVLAWLLPAKVSIAILMFTQMLTFVIVGETIKQQNDHDKEA